jgi:tetratricopeptide (TPR) repeat protein
MRGLILAAAVVFLANAAGAADQPVYAPPAAWVKPLETPKPPAVDDSASTRILSESVQDKFVPDGLDSYWERAERIQTPQGLSNIGNIAFDWNPDTDTLIIHRLRIIRGSQAIDLLAGGQRFIVLRRENKLEYAMLDGTLTAAIQPEGLEVGDILDIATTIQSRDPILKGKSSRIAVIPPSPTDHFVIREIWPKSESPKRRQTGGLDAPTVTSTGDETELLIDMKNAIRPKAPKLAPGRFNRPGEFEISQVAGWPEVSALMAPFFEKTSQLVPDSPVKAEIAKIKAASNDPKTRAAAALHLVQDRIRYLFLGMNNGGFIPVEADKTWLRRFGDCKGKTVLLLALLHELDIKAEPALVDTEGGDDLDVRTPMATAFDHVMVRAEIDGKTYWLDGTRPGDRDLDTLPIPNFGWALPLRAAGAALERLSPTPLEKPDEFTNLHLDASAGLDVSAPAHADLILRGDEAVDRKLKLADMTPAEVETYLRDYWRDEYDWIDVKKVDAAYDDKTGEEHLSMDGLAKMEWKGGTSTLGRRYETDGAVLGWKADYARDPGPNLDAPFTVRFPYFGKTTETVVLPNGGSGFTIEGDMVDKVIAGREMKRKATIERGVFSMEVSTRAISPEFPAADAPAAQTALRDLSHQTIYLRAPSFYKKTDQEIAALPAPTTADDFFGRAFQFDLRDDHEHAIENYGRAVALKPEWALAYANRGLQYFSKGDIAQASTDFDKALKFDPREAVAYRGQGLVYTRNGEFKEAIDAYSHSLDIEPDRIFALEHRAQAYTAIGDFVAAIADIDAVLRQQPDRTDLHRQLANLLITRNDSARLFTEADTLSRLNDDGSAHLARGYAYIFQGKMEDGRKEFDGLIAAKPSSAAYLGRALTFGESQNDERLQNLDLALKLEPESISALFTRAAVYLAVDRPDPAIQDLDIVVQKLPDSVQAASMRSEALEKLHRYDQALTELDGLLAKNPNNPVLLNNRCWLRALWGKDLPVALVDCDLSLKEKQAPATLDSRGLVYFRLGRFDDAIADYDSALKLHPQLPSSLFGRGMAKLRSGAKDAAAVDLAAARQVDPKVEVQFADYGVKP